MLRFFIINANTSQKPNIKLKWLMKTKRLVKFFFVQLVASIYWRLLQNIKLTYICIFLHFHRSAFCVLLVPILTLYFIKLHSSQQTVFITFIKYIYYLFSENYNSCILKCAYVICFLFTHITNIFNVF